MTSGILVLWCCVISLFYYQSPNYSVCVCVCVQLITSPSEENKMYVQQRDEFLESVCDMAIRKISIITIFGSLANSTMKIDHYQLGKRLPHTVLFYTWIVWLLPQLYSLRIQDMFSVESLGKRKRKRGVKATLMSNKTVVLGYANIQLICHGTSLRARLKAALLRWCHPRLHPR